ncbi:MAG: hypothetical protein OXB84_08455 [Halobacteriovoraceae bacterium]|nr:hypothetical protein [Halobacteriovoraceae bacterium]
MNGIKLKSKLSVKNNKSNLKTLICIILSNVFLFLLLLPERPQQGLLTHVGMEKLLLPIKIFIPLLPGKTEYPVELYDENHRLLARPAFLHPDFSSIPSDFSNTILHIPVEVPKNAIKKLIGKSLFLAFPRQETSKKPEKRKLSYEIIF